MKVLMDKEITTDDVLTGELDSYIADIWGYIELEMNKICREDQDWTDAFFGWDDSSIDIMKDRFHLSYEVIANLVLGTFIETKPDDANRFARKCKGKHREEQLNKLALQEAKSRKLEKKEIKVQRSNAGKASKDKKAVAIVSEHWHKKPEDKSYKAFVLDMVEQTDKSESTIKRYIKEIRKK